jgi:hypothetical protein
MYPQQYKLTPAAYQAARKRILNALPILMVLFTVPFTLTWFLNPVRMPIEWGKMWAICGAVVLFVSIRMVRLLQKQKIAYDEFVIIIDEQRITGKNLLHQEIDFAYIEVTQIVKQVNGSFILVGGPQNMVINIPADIENREQLEASLNNITPIAVNPVNWFTRYLRVMLGALFALIILFIYTSNKIITGITTPILIAAFLWLFLNMRTTADEKKPHSAKQIIGFSVIILAILAKAFYVFSGRF